jgi:transposase-like protein
MSHKKFTPEFKENAVEYALKNTHKTMLENAQSLGVGQSTLDKWIRDYCAKNNIKKPALTEEQKRIKQLEKENSDLREVNEILKKAHKYFVSQSR